MIFQTFKYESVNPIIFRSDSRTNVLHICFIRLLNFTFVFAVCTLSGSTSNLQLQVRYTFAMVVDPYQFFYRVTVLGKFLLHFLAWGKTVLVGKNMFVDLSIVNKIS